MSHYALLVIELVMGSLTFAFTAFALIPQIISIRKTRNTSGISLVSNIICNVDNIFWLIWTFGFYFNSMYMYKETYLRMFQMSLLILCFTYVFGCTLAAYILFMKIVHLYKAKHLKVTELQLAKILLDKDKNKFFVDKQWNNFKRYLFPILFIVFDLLIAFSICSILYVFGYVQPIKDSGEWIWVVVLGFISSVIWEATTWPQLVKSISEKDMTGLSLFWCIFGAVNCIVSFSYDLALAFGTSKFNYDILFIVIFSGIAPAVGILILKIINISKAKKVGMTELEYTKQVLIPLVKKKKELKRKQKSA